MIWAKRRFEYAEYAPYQERLEKLVMANPGMLDQFLMVAVDIKKPRLSEYYVGLPSDVFLPLFDDFQQIHQSEVPQVIDTLVIGSHPAVEALHFPPRDIDATYKTKK